MALADAGHLAAGRRHRHRLRRADTKGRGKRLRAGIAVLIAVIAFVVCNLLMVLLSQRPALL